MYLSCKIFCNLLFMYNFFLKKFFHNFFLFITHLFYAILHFFSFSLSHFSSFPHLQKAHPRHILCTVKSLSGALLKRSGCRAENIGVGSWEKLKAVPEKYWSRFLKKVGSGVPVFFVGLRLRIPFYNGIRQAFFNQLRQLRSA